MPSKPQRQRQIPQHRSEESGREFWATVDSTVPCQSLLEVFLAERIRQEFSKLGQAG